MKASVLKTDKRIETTNLKSCKIQTYGANNDHPQRVIEIVDGSGTAQSCLDIKVKFLIGRGFAQADFFRAIVDDNGTKMDELLRLVSVDYATFKGFAIHVNYNALFEVVSATHIPFEQVRFEQLDEKGEFCRLCTHPDWGKRNTALRKFTLDDQVWFHFFDPSPEAIQKQVDEAGGWEFYTGQILYYSGDGFKVYPKPSFEAVLTDMVVEEGLSNITHRNVKNNFLPAGMLIDYDNSPNSEEQEEETKKEIAEFQGDMNAGKLFYISVTDREKKPEFVPFEGRNFDKEFTEAEVKIPQIIGRAFQQPPILRAEDVGANFGADLMRNAYDFYNSITEDERMTISQQFAKIFSHWYDPGINPDNNYDILPRVYRVNATIAERLEGNTKDVLELLFDATKKPEAKKAVLMKVYGLEEDEIDYLLENL